LSYTDGDFGKIPLVVSELKVALFCVDDLPATQAARRKGRREMSANRDKGKETGSEKGKEKGKETGKEKGKETGKERGKETGKEKGKASEKAVLREPLDNEEGRFIGYRFLDVPSHQ